MQIAAVREQEEASELADLIVVDESQVLSVDIVIGGNVSMLAGFGLVNIFDRRDSVGGNDEDDESDTVGGEDEGDEPDSIGAEDEDEDEDNS